MTKARNLVSDYLYCLMEWMGFCGNRFSEMFVNVNVFASLIKYMVVALTNGF